CLRVHFPGERRGWRPYRAQQPLGSRLSHERRKAWYRTTDSDPLVKATWVLIQCAAQRQPPPLVHVPKPHGSTPCTGVPVSTYRRLGKEGRTLSETAQVIPAIFG